jgi:hypothetical protein
MPIPGQTRRAYCPVCGQETQWEYIGVQLDDCFLGLDNVIHPEAHQIKRWRCCDHHTLDGRMKDEFKRKTRPAAVVRP